MDRRLLLVAGLLCFQTMAEGCTSAPAATPAPTPPPVWTYVVLGDSSSWAFPQFYARYMEADLKIKVNVINRTIGGVTSAGVLDQIRTDQQVRKDVGQANVVTFYGNPLDLIGMRIVTGRQSDAYDCSPQKVATYKAEMGAMASEILALRKGQPTIIRTYTRFMPFYRIWREAGQFDEFRRCLAALDAAILEMGRERGILVVDVGVALNGPNHDQDPTDKGYISGDGIHENDAGGQAVADVFRAAGYATIVP
jgi:lysophospholipase L1-like esterase